MSLQEVDLEQQQVLGHRLLRRHVGHAGQRKHAVRPARSRSAAATAASVCAATTLSSARPWISSSGRDSDRRVVEQRVRPVRRGLLLRRTEIALRIEGVVERPVGDRRSGDRDVKDVRAAQARRGRRASRRTTSRGSRPGVRSRSGSSSAAACSASTWSSSTGPAKSRWISRSHAGSRPGVPAAVDHQHREALVGEPLRLEPGRPGRDSTRCACGPPYGSSSTGSFVPGDVVARQHQPGAQLARPELQHPDLRLERRRHGAATSSGHAVGRRVHRRPVAEVLEAGRRDDRRAAADDRRGARRRRAASSTTGSPSQRVERRPTSGRPSTP